MRITDGYEKMTKRAPRSIEEYVADKLDGSDYGVGRMEAADATARNTASALGRLLEVLVRDRRLDASDLSHIIGRVDVVLVEGDEEPEDDD